MPQTLYDKLWDSHVVHVEPDGTALLYIDRHLVHEVTSAQAFEGLREAGRKPWRVESVVATADHNTPTTHWEEGLAGVRDPFAKLQIETLDANIRQFGAKVYFPYLDRRHGIRDRVRRSRDAFALDGRAHDGLQHGDRSRRPRRHGGGRRGHHRIPARSKIRAVGRAVGPGGRLLAHPRE